MSHLDIILLRERAFSVGAGMTYPGAALVFLVPAFPWFLMLTQLFFPDVGAGQAAREPCGGEASLL